MRHRAHRFVLDTISSTAKLNMFVTGVLNGRYDTNLHVFAVRYPRQF